jgi:TetR/AcrR family tetracycline transcriptional repressor
MVSHRDGGRVVAGASFRARTLEKLHILTTRVLNEAGFDLLHANLAAGTTIHYIWGDVIEEQAGEGPEREAAASQGQEAASRFELDLLDAIMTERAKLTATEKFDWGLRVIVSGLKSALANSTNDVKT